MTPVTVPPAVTVAVLVLLLLHAPPGVALESAVLPPTQTVAVPVMGAGLVFTVTTTLLVQPLLPKHVIVVVPPDRPLTTPDDEPMVATAVFELVQVEPPMDDDSVVLAPTHTAAVPVMAGAGETVAMRVMTHPEDGGA